MIVLPLIVFLVGSATMIVLPLIVFLVGSGLSFIAFGYRVRKGLDGNKFTDLLGIVGLPYVFVVVLIVAINDWRVDRRFDRKLKAVQGGET